MAIAANSYGTAAGVGVYARNYADTNQEFTDATTPTLTEVEEFIDEVSAILNVQLAAHRFSIPITQADAKRMLDNFVNQEAAALVLGMHNHGRFGPSNKQMVNGRFSLLLSDIQSFLAANQNGLEAIGATRTNTQTAAGSRALVRADGYSNDYDAVESWNTDE